MINQELQQGQHLNIQNGSAAATQDQSKQNQGSCQQKQQKKSSEGSVHTITSISTSNKIAYDNSIDEFSRQQIPSENDMSKGMIKLNNQNLNKHLKAIPEMSPFKSLADKNTHAQSLQSRKFQYSKINNNSICIEKLEFKINQPKKDQASQQSKGVQANQIFQNQDVAFSHSVGNQIQLNQLDKFSPQNRLNFYNTSQRRLTAQEYFKAQGQRTTTSESPKKSFRYSKIFNSQPYAKDSSNNISQPQLNNNSSLVSLNNNRSNIQYNTTNRNGSVDLEYLKNKECVYIVRQKQISEQKDNSNIQSVAQKVIEITKNQQEYLQNMQKQYNSNQSVTFNQSYLQFPNLQQSQQQHQQYPLQGQQLQGQFLINQNTPKKQVFIQNQNIQQISNQISQQQNFSYQPTRNQSVQQIFVPQQQNYINNIQQQQQQQLTQPHLVNNQNLFQVLNVNRSLPSVGQEQPQRSFSTGQNPYFIQQRRIFTETSQRDFSPQFRGKANSLKLSQGKAQQIGANNIMQLDKQLSVSNQGINQQELPNQKQILLLNQENQYKTKNELSQINRQTIGGSIRNSTKAQDNLKQVDQSQYFSQGQSHTVNDENKNRDTVSSLNSFGNPTKFTVIGQGIGARFSFCKNQVSQQEIQSSQLQENNILREKNQDKKSEFSELRKQNTFSNENQSCVPQQKVIAKENEEQLYMTNQLTEKSTAAGLITIQSDFEQLNTKGTFTNNYQSLKNQNEAAKLSCDRSSQRKSLTSGPVSSIYSPLKNYFKENSIQQKSNVQQPNDDQVPITPVSMMQQNKGEANKLLQDNILKIQNNREEAAEPLEMYPSQYDPNENLQRENRLQSFKKQDLNKAQDKNQRTTNTQSIDEYDQNNNQFQSNNSIFQVQLLRNSSSGKKFSLNKLKQIITSDSKNAECSQYIDQYTNSKNKELIEKHKSRIQRIYNTTMTNTSADNHFYDRILGSFEKNSVIARNTDNRYSHSVSRNYSSWNPFYIQESNQANQSLDRSNKIVQIQQIFQNQGQNLSLTPPNVNLNNNTNNNNPTKESSINVKPFTVSSFQATPINKLQENRDNNSFLIQDSTPQIKNMNGLTNQQNQNIFMEKQQALENLPANKMTNDPEENKKFQRNMILSAQPAAKQINEEIESKRTFLESDRQAPPAQLLQTCYSYENKFKPSPKYQQKVSSQNQMQNVIQNQNLTQNFNENKLIQLKEDQNSLQNPNLPQIQNKSIENLNSQFNRNRSASSGFVYSNPNQKNEIYNNYLSEKQITDKQTSPTQDLPITKQLQQKYQQAVHQFNEKQEQFANQLKPKLQNQQGVELTSQKQGSDTFQSFTFTRKKSANELSKSNINTKNSLNLSVELKKKSLFLPPKPQQQQQTNNNTSQSSSLQNQSYEDIKKGPSVQNVDPKNQKSQIFKNPRSIKDSIINGRQTYSQSFEDVKNSELFVQSLSSPLVKLSDICQNKSYTTASVNAKDTKFSGQQNLSGQRLKTFDDNYDFNQSCNYNSLQLYSHKKQGNSQHSFLDKEIANKIIQINTDQHILDVNQEEDKENTQESIIKSNKFPLFQEFFSSIQKEYQNSLQENQILQLRQYNSNLSTQEASYLQSQQCQLKNISSISSQQSQKMHQLDEVKEANQSKNYSQKSDLICSYSSYQSQNPNQVDSQMIRSEQNQVKQFQSSQASIRQNQKAQNLKSYQQSKSCTDNDSSLFNKSSSTIPQNDQSNSKSISDSILNKIGSNLLKEKSFPNNKSNDTSQKQSQILQQKRQIKQRVFQKDENKLSQIKQQQREALEAQNQIRTVSNNSITQSQLPSQARNPKSNNNPSQINSKENSVNNLRQNTTENNSDNSNMQIYSNKNDTKMNIQYNSNNKINQSTLQQNNIQTNNIQNNQPYATQSNVPTQHSLQNTSNNISKITDCSNSKLLQIFMANSQLDLLTGGNNNKNYLTDLITANQKLAQSIQQQFKQQQEQNHQNITNLCLNCNKLVPSKDYINHSQVCNIENNQHQFININLKGDDHQNKLNQNDNLNYLHQKQIECNKNLELVKLQAHQKLHSGETFSASRLCLYANFFIECLNLIIINNQSYKELKSSLNDLTAIMEKIAISGEDDHTEQFLAFAHKGYEIGLQKLGIIKRLK
ncbi:hypothetical protein ABPG74_016634 [Tetrahymena malaccensis]